LPRKARRRVRSAGSCTARIAIASSAAFLAPGFPIARLPTGIPAGIWAMESNESNPFNALLSTGTPNTGSVVCAATMPGKWAAPPAPAIITSMPLRSAVSANVAIFLGVRCAEVISLIWPIPKSFRILAASCIVSQSDLLPIRIATRCRAIRSLS